MNESVRSRRRSPARGPIRRFLRLAAVLVLAGSASLLGGCSIENSAARVGRAGGHGDDPASTAPSATPPAQLMDAVCGDAPEVSDAGRINTPEITEASGLVASWVNADAWWITNDSGDTARIFALGTDGDLLATVDIAGAEARDWESLAIGPPMHGMNPTLYVGDTGNNLMRTDKAATSRTTMRVYRFTEPVIDRGTVPQQLRATAETLNLRFADGPHDVEAMVVDPVSGDLVFVTKEWSRLGTSGVYRSPAGLAAGSTTTLERVGEVPLEPGTLVTGADVTRDGSLVALRSYGAVDLYRRPAGEPLWAAFSTTPCSGPSPGELQGESIGFAPDGGSYMTVAEGPDPVLHLTVP